MMNSKAYTNTEQSKILAQIIDKETADFCWGIDQENSNDNVFVYNCTPYPLPWKDYTTRDFYLPCWSLAALIAQLDETITTDYGYFDLHILVKNGGYYVQYDDNYEGKILVESGFQEHLIDAVFDVLVKLKENKLI